MYILPMASQSISKLRLRFTHHANFYTNFIREFFVLIVSSVTTKYILEYIRSIKNKNYEVYLSYYEINFVVLYI